MKNKLSSKISTILAIIMLTLPVLSACQSTAATAAIPTSTMQVNSAPPKPTATATPLTKPAAATPTLSTKPTLQPTVAAIGSGKKVCEVTDTGGIDDRASNAITWKGLSAARDETGVEAKYLEAAQQTDFAKNINAFIAEKCDLIVTVGSLLADDTKAAAEKNPGQKFVIVDYTYNTVIPNVLSLTFATDQAGFLAGYLAASMTKTGKIATFGGVNIPAVTSYMDGFYYGAEYYNQQNKAKVLVLGWDPRTQKGSFTNSMIDTSKSEAAAQSLLVNGVDIIMPVSGQAGAGAGEAIKAVGNPNTWIINVDPDWTVSASDYKDIILASATKNIDLTVYTAVKSVLDGSFKGGTYEGNLQNGGTDLNNIAANIPAAITAKLNQVKADIIAGKVKVNPNAK